jgi:hypothetical protein
MSIANKPGQADQRPDTASKEAMSPSSVTQQNTGAPLPDEVVVASYVANNVPHCKKCGQQTCRDNTGQPICPYGATDCPVVTE